MQHMPDPTRQPPWHKDGSRLSKLQGNYIHSLFVSSFLRLGCPNQNDLCCRGLHFLAIQDDPDAESCTGLWLLLATKSAV